MTLSSVSDMVKKTEHSKTLSGMFKGTDTHIALTGTIVEIARDLRAQGVKISQRSVYRMPDLRAYRNETDKCDKCFELKKTMAYLKKLAGEVPAPWVDELLPCARH